MNANTNIIHLFIQVQHQEIIVQHPCPIPNGTRILQDHWLLRENHVLDEKDPESFTIVALFVTTITLFLLTCFVFVMNVRKLFHKENKSRKRMH